MRPYLDLLVYVFPPIDGKYFLWNHSEQIMSIDEIRKYPRDQDIIHLSLRHAEIDPRISKEARA